MPSQKQQSSLTLLRRTPVVARPLVAALSLAAAVAVLVSSPSESRAAGTSGHVTQLCGYVPPLPWGFTGQSPTGPGLCEGVCSSGWADGHCQDPVDPGSHMVFYGCPGGTSGDSCDNDHHGGVLLGVYAAGEQVSFSTLASRPDLDGYCTFQLDVLRPTAGDDVGLRDFMIWERDDCSPPPPSSCLCPNGTDNLGNPVTGTTCGQQVCGADFQYYSCEQGGWAAQGGSCGAPQCDCANRWDDQGNLVTGATCGQVMCGGDYQWHACGQDGWEAQGGECGSPPCWCGNEWDENGYTVISTTCGETMCGFDHHVRTCGQDGWEAQSEECGTPSCFCSHRRTDQGNYVASTTCGETICDYDYQVQTCGLEGWEPQGVECAPSSCSCPNGTDDQGNTVTSTTCGEQVCGLDKQWYMCRENGWASQGGTCSTGPCENSERISATIGGYPFEDFCPADLCVIEDLLSDLQTKAPSLLGLSAVTKVISGGERVCQPDSELKDGVIFLGEPTIRAKSQGIRHTLVHELAHAWAMTYGKSHYNFLGSKTSVGDCWRGPSAPIDSDRCYPCSQEKAGSSEGVARCYAYEFASLARALETAPNYWQGDFSRKIMGDLLKMQGEEEDFCESVVAAVGEFGVMNDLTSPPNEDLVWVDPQMVQPEKDFLAWTYGCTDGWNLSEEWKTAERSITTCDPTTRIQNLKYYLVHPEQMCN